MYTVIFSDIDKNLLNSIQDLKSKKGFSLNEANQLLKDIHKSINEVKKITITINDLENKLKYIFDNITINSSRTVPKLIDIQQCIGDNDSRCDRILILR